MEKTICELFAGVGGFRLGFENLGSGWETVWFSQWEPGASKQWAHDCYVSHFGDSPDVNGEYHTGEDIALVDKRFIPDHTLLVGGFPCQDYSVAHPLSSAKGLEGKKGVLWWQIYDTLQEKRPPFCLFENVDRLLKSPAGQRGRDFGVMLSCLDGLGYSAEWRVVNAATYGAAQRRRRVFIFAYRNDTGYHKNLNATATEVLRTDGFMAKAFPIRDLDGNVTGDKISDDPVEMSDRFSYDFAESGFMTNGYFYIAKVQGPEIPVGMTLGSVLEKNVGSEYYITDEIQISRWAYLKGAKKVHRVAANGHEYDFSEGPIAFPDLLDKPSRTMLTSESTLNRSTHVVRDPDTGTLRILTPVEAERLQGFDDGWTDTGMPRRMRYFCMGNALVVPMIERMGRVLDQIVEKED